MLLLPVLFVLLFISLTPSISFIKLFELAEFVLLVILLFNIFLKQSHKLLLLLDSQINFTINAVINANIVYASVAIKNVSSNAANVTIKNIANIKAATAIGHFKSFCNIADIIIKEPDDYKKIFS